MTVTLYAKINKYFPLKCIFWTFLENLLLIHPIFFCRLREKGGPNSLVIKILLVDSDPAIRQYISHSIDWDSFGAAIIAEASNGNEAFFLAVKHSPDIILTDIQLPLCDGMELIAKLHKIHSPSRVLILTNSKDEDYLLNAIKLGVKDYLLKQTNISYIKVAIQKLCEQITEEKKFLSEMQLSKELFQKHLRVIQSDFLNRLLGEKQLTPELRAEALQLNIFFDGPKYQILLLRCPFGQFWNLLTYVEQFSQVFHPSVWRIGQEDLCGILINSASEQETHLFWMNLTKRNRNLFSPENQYFILTPATASLSELSDQYRIGLRMAKCTLLFSKNSVISTRDWSAPIRPFTLSALFRAEEKLVLAMRMQGRQDFDTQAEDYLSTLRSSLVPDSETRHSLFRILLRSVSRNTLSPSELDEKERNLKNLSDTSEVRSFLDSLYQETGISTEDNSELIREVKRYVEKNYANKISLNLIAKENFVSPSYLSTLFHKETGMAFIQWLQQYRIEQAKSLLATGRYKNYEIASMVGFTDYKTFAKYFSRYTGTNAKEFMNQFDIVYKPDTAEQSGSGKDA